MRKPGVTSMLLLLAVMSGAALAETRTVTLAVSKMT